MEDSKITSGASMQKEKNKPLYELARPNTLEEIVLDDVLYNKLSQLTDDFQTLPHLVFYGPPGTGKTTTARAIARKILQKLTGFNYLELNASVDRGVDVIRSQILKFVSNTSFTKIGSPNSPYKIVFLDEADALTPDAQNALRNMMETYASNSRFILSCNYFAKIIPAIASRSLAFEFKPLDQDKMYSRLKKVVEDYRLEYDDQDLHTAVKNSKGDFRVAFNNLHRSYEQKDYSIQVQNLVEFTVSKAPNLPLSQVEQIYRMKKDVLDNHQRIFFEQLTEKLCGQAKEKSLFSVIDRLARAQWAIMLGGSPYTQFLGWLTYYLTTWKTR